MTRLTLTVKAAAVGAAVAAIESLRPSLVPRGTVHQAGVTTLAATTGMALGASLGTASGVALRGVRGEAAATRGLLPGPAQVAVAAGLLGAGAARAVRNVRVQRAAHPAWGPKPARPALAAAGGLALATGLAGTGIGVAAGVGAVSRRVSVDTTDTPILWTTMVSTATLGLSVGVLAAAKRRLLTNLEGAGRQADRALAGDIADPHVAGGPDSLVPPDSLSREGRRFVNWRVSADDVLAGALPARRAPQESVRVFVGVDSAVDAANRVELAMEELERLGAWTKAYVVAASPAGSGYVNSIPIEALEYFTGGDCASVVVQYGVLPSMFSGPVVPLAAHTYRLLLDRIRHRLAGIAAEDRPKLVLYGESLGARAAQTALDLEPALVDRATAEVDGVHAALFVGTPGGSSLRNDLLDHPGTVHLDCWQDLDSVTSRDATLWFLDHHADPVTRYETAILWRSPDFLRRGVPRGRNIPADLTWRPLVTWQQLGMDVAYATQPQSGVFRSLGHDYRADLTRVVAAAILRDPGAPAQEVEHLIAEREIARDSLLSAAEAGAEGAAIDPQPEGTEARTADPA